MGWIQSEQDRGSAFQSLESRKIRRPTEAQLRTDQLEDYTCLSDSVQSEEDREKLLSTRGIWQELFGGKTSSGRGGINGIPRRENNLNKGAEAG